MTITKCDFCGEEHQPMYKLAINSTNGSNYDICGPCEPKLKKLADSKPWAKPAPK